MEGLTSTIYVLQMDCLGSGNALNALNTSKLSTIKTLLYARSS